MSPLGAGLATAAAAAAAGLAAPPWREWRAELLFFLRPAPTGTFLIVPPAVQYLWQFLQKCLGWLTL